MKIYLYFFFIFSFFIVLGLRLFQLTIVKGQYFRNLSDQNRIKELIIEAPRGEISDRKGFVLAKSTEPDVTQIKDRITSHRTYVEPQAIAPLIGYRQLADEKDLKNDNCLYKIGAGDKVGKKGAEATFDCFLRGVPGKKLIEIDARGKFLRTLNVIPPQPGHNIQLAVDLDLQKKAYELMKDKKGAIVANNPQTGEILALVSTPSFDPQDFEDKNDNMIEKYLSDKERPLFNRVTAGIYAPGSVFKLAIATAALESKTIDEKTEFEDTGIITAGPLKFGNWYFLQYGRTEGMVDVVKAIRRSNDIFFYLAGAKTGEENIKKWAEILGYGKNTGIPIEEETGLIPSPFWKEENIGDRWYLGDSYNLSIGQGYVSVTPLQTVVTTAVFANNGSLCQPKLLKDEKPSCEKLPISKKTVDLVREGMKQACSTGGTGWPLFDFKVADKSIQTACKTGTAESHASSGQPHAWITVFAPYDKPEIALTVLIEEGGQGSDVAGPIAKELLKTYFERSE